MTEEEIEEQSLWNSPTWFPLGMYDVGDIVRYGTALYQCIESHYGESDWNPADYPKLWKRIR